MTDSQVPALSRRIESGLFYLARKPETLACLLEALLPPSLCLGLLQKIPGKRTGGGRPALQLARRLQKRPALGHALAQAVAGFLPETDPPPRTYLKKSSAAWLRRESLLAALRDALGGGAEPEWKRAEGWIEAWHPFLGKAEDPDPPAPKPQAPPPPAPPAAASNGQVDSLRREKHQLQKDLKAERRRAARLQKEIGKTREERDAARQEAALARAKTQEARRRAAGQKRELKQAAAPSRREGELKRKLEDLRREHALLKQKFRIREDEIQDLLDIQKDREHFRTLPEEDIPSFRGRPLQPEEQELSQALQARAARGKPPFRVLVVGGGEPQLRHREKLEEFAQVVGFESTWRMADYSSWHQTIDSLKTDMQSRFDALVILHWNRTTFTRVARDICNHAGQKPCITCNYQGFVNLRTTLRECLRQLQAAEAPRKKGRKPRPA